MCGCRLILNETSRRESNMKATLLNYRRGRHTQKTNQIFLSTPALFQRCSLSRRLMLSLGRERRRLPGRFIEYVPP